MLQNHGNGAIIDEANALNQVICGNILEKWEWSDSQLPSWNVIKSTECDGHKRRVGADVFHREHALAYTEPQHVWQIVRINP